MNACRSYSALQVAEEFLPYRPGVAASTAAAEWDDQPRTLAGTPISVSERFAGYRESRRGAKQAVVRLTADLQAALETML